MRWPLPGTLLACKSLDRCARVFTLTLRSASLPHFGADDEADFTSLTFRRKEGVVSVGVIASQIDVLRKLVKSATFLQVMANSSRTKGLGLSGRHATDFLRWLAECVFRPAGCEGRLRKTCTLAGAAWQ